MDMSKINSYDDLSSWIEKQTTEINRSKYGRNRQSLVEGIEQQRNRSKDIIQVESKLTQILNRTYDVEKKRRLKDNYDQLKAAVEKKLHCLETMLQVASLEENCSRLSRDFDVRSVSLVKSQEHHTCSNDDGTDSASATCKNLSGFIATASQDCINGLKNNWDWVVNLVKCIDIHLKNASDYHQFFHEVEESERWMLSDFSSFSATFENQGKNSEKEAAKITSDLDAIYVSLRQWEAKTNRLWNKASQLVPVPLRTDGIREQTPATSLSDYETKDISFAAGEDVLLLDNSNTESWRVRNGKGEEAEVPPVIILIPGPCKEAVDLATKLQLQLLTTWTNALKRIGVRLICHMMTVFKPEYNTREISALASMGELDKNHLLKLLTHIENSLQKYWSDHEGFLRLQERLLALRMAVEEIGDGDQKDADLYKSLIVQISALGQIMNMYQDMFKDWEKFKVAVETSKSPELMLIVDKWEQLQFVSRDYFSKFWKMKLPLDDQEKSFMRTRNFTLDGIQLEDTVGLTPRPDSARSSANISCEPPRRNCVRSLYSDEVFQDGVDKQEAMSIVQESCWETIDGWKDEKRNGVKGEEPGIRRPLRAEVTVQNTAGMGSITEAWNEEGFHETAEKTTTTKIYGTGEEQKKNIIGSDSTKKESRNEASFESKTVTNTTTKTSDHGDQSKNATGKQDEAWNVEKGFDETTTRTTTTKTLENARRNVLHDDPGWSRTDGFEETRTITTSSTISSADGPTARAEGGTSYGFGMDGVTVKTGRAADDDGGSRENGFSEVKTTIIHDRKTETGQKKEPTRTVRRLQSSQTSFSEVAVEEGGLEELKEEQFIHNRLSSSDYEGAKFGLASETKTAETEQLNSAEMEENKTFVIRSVINPSDKAEISLQQAIVLGVIRPTDGVYVNGESGDSVPIASAMSDGLIKVMFSTTKRTPEKVSSIGIITIKTVRRMARPCSITSVRDSLTEEEVTQQEAERRGILDEQQGFYTDRKTSRKMMISDAVDNGLLTIEFSGEEPEPEVITKTFAVRAVVDRCLKKTITFHDAVKRGIIDKDSGAYRDTVTNEKMYIGDAIMRGFLKARIIEDAHGLNIDPENKMVIDKTQKIRERLLKPLKVISAFKMAGKDASHKH